MRNLTAAPEAQGVRGAFLASAAKLDEASGLLYYDNMKTLRNFLLAIVVLFAAVISVPAQTGGAPPTRGRPTPAEPEFMRRLESENLGRKLGEQPRRKGDRPVGLAQLKEDFLFIQVANNDLRTYGSQKDFDFKLLAKSASEISKRAKRLRDKLALPELDRTSELQPLKAGTELEQLRLALSVLSSSIDSFVQNPVFETVGVVDAKLSAAARRDLEQIIESSQQTKKICENLERLARAATRP